MMSSDVGFKKHYLGTFEMSVSKIKILLLYIAYPLAMASYFIKALKHRDDVDLLTAGPYTGSWIPWMGGMSLPEKYANSPDIPLPFGPNVGRVNYHLVRSQLPQGWKPDLVLCIDAGINWDTKPVDGLVATIGTDPHVLDYDHARKVSDKFFNMQATYSKAEDIYLPYAYSQYDHYPINGTIFSQPGDTMDHPLEYVEYVEKDIDAVLIGMPYENRVKWVNELRKRSVSVIFENGPVYDEARVLYNRGRIGLNWSSMDDLNARSFELAAMKLYPVMNRVLDMNFFKHFSYCGLFENTLDDAVEKVMWAKEHPEDAQRLAELSYNAVQGQTYDARVSLILRECGLE